MQDTGKALQEKVTLSRELDRLRLELEHQKMQVANHQSIVAEKHSLQRQLDTLEVELENEKRARKRAQDKEGKGTIDALRGRAEEAEKRLALEQREFEKSRKANDKLLSQEREQSERLEERLDTLQKKFKMAQSDLKDTRAKLAQSQAELEKAYVAIGQPRRSVDIASLGNRKGHVDDSGIEEITIPTLGNEGEAISRPTRKRGLEQSILGQKSAFSVTPYLNRHGDIPNAPHSDHTSSPAALEPYEAGNNISDGEESLQGAKDDEGPEADSLPLQTEKRVGKDAQPQKTRGRPRKVLSAVPSSKRSVSEHSDRPITGPPKKILPIASGQENKQKVGLRGVREQTRESGELTQAQISVGMTASSAISGLEVKKKKRKLLGGAQSGTILDVDDGEVDQPPPPPQRLPVNGIRKRAHLVGNTGNAFGNTSFSPLKRDKRGVNASFLA
jgi:hypothetical protein